MNIYPNTPIIEQPEPIAFTIGYYAGNLILPLAMILYVILYFRNDKCLYLYVVLMSLLFLMAPAWFIVVAGLALMGLDKASKWAKERTKDD